MSTVVWNGGEVVLPINEPADGRKKSQIEEYLDYYRSPGVQHLALATDDIVSAVDALRQRGVRFMDVPPQYYEEARARMAGIDLPWDELSSLGILVDRDQRGHLLQVFTETVCDRPTVFFEVIQREGATGFGEGNFKALFESIERAQDGRRGRPRAGSAGVVGEALDQHDGVGLVAEAGPVDRISGGGNRKPRREASTSARAIVASRWAIVASASSPSVACSRCACACATNGASSGGSGSGVGQGWWFLRHGRWSGGGYRPAAAPASEWASGAADGRSAFRRPCGRLLTRRAVSSVG